ncbi:hypothetical protein Leryth_018541 [Lithospermum erythrorhizon]|nr:hypothetical protein Leryth_018541 [Lithospermum erythrorhizon]
MEKASLTLILLFAFMFVAPGPIIISNARRVETTEPMYNFALRCQTKVDCSDLSGPGCKIVDCVSGQCIYSCD